MKRSEILAIAQEALENGEDCVGVCHACGETQEGCEPDARGYECESCGENKVYGAEETLLMLV